MATIINADTSNGLKLTSDTSGEIELQSGGSTIATVDSTGLTMASGKNLVTTGPAFSAYQSSTQTLSAGVSTKIQCQTEEFDTASAYDNTTNYRFTPQVAGYYQFNGAWTAGVTANNVTVAIYKNGAEAKRGQNVQATAAMMTVSCIVYLNGSTDYAELYATTQTGQAGALASYFTYFQGYLARSA
jgi:hypothetical protein